MILQLELFTPIRSIDTVEFVSTGYYYSSSRREISHAMKQGNQSAIRLAAAAMAVMFDLPENAVLVPVPSHFGYATYTLDLANELAKLTGSEVADVLRGSSREMLYDRKKQRKSVSVKYLGLYITEKLPIDKQIFFVDNVVATGTTAKAAYKAFGRGTVLAFSHAKRHSR